jgi:hypothetical protein
VRWIVVNTKDELLTPKEAATRAKVSRSLFYTWCDERRLPHVGAGASGNLGRTLIRVEDLEAMLRLLRVDAHPLLASA